MSYQMCVINVTSKSESGHLDSLNRFRIVKEKRPERGVTPHSPGKVGLITPMITQTTSNSTQSSFFSMILVFEERTC